MRLCRLTIAAVLLASAVPASACELDGPGGHRFFAFAGMYRGGSGDQPAQDRDKASQEEQEQSDRDRQGGNGGSEPGSSGSDSQPEDPTTFR